MTAQQIANLEATLDRVPTHLLREALRRRRALTIASAALTDTKRAQYKVALDIIAQRHHLEKEDILGACKIPAVVHARWALYRRLHDLGFTAGEIVSATGHDRTRIAHGLKHSMA